MTSSTFEKLNELSEMDSKRQQQSAILHKASIANYKQFTFYKVLIVILLLTIIGMFYYIFSIFEDQALYVLDQQGYTYYVKKTNLTRHDAEITAFLKDAIDHQLSFSKDNYVSQREYLRNIVSENYFQILYAEDQQNTSLAKTINQSEYAKVYMAEFAVESIQWVSASIQVVFSAVRNVDTGDKIFPEEIRAKAIITITKRTPQNPFGLKLISTTKPE